MITTGQNEHQTIAKQVAYYSHEKHLQDEARTF